MSTQRQQQGMTQQGGEHKIGATPKEELRHKDYTAIFSELWTKLTQQYDDFMAGKSQGLNSILETAKNNYEYLKQKGSEGAENVSEQLKDKNNKLMEKLKSSNESAKQSIKENYTKLTESLSEGKDIAGDKLNSLKESMKQGLNNLGDSSTDAYRNAMKKIDEFQGKTKEEYEQFYNEMSKNMEDVYNESVDKIKEYFSYDEGQNVSGRTAKAS